MGDGGFLPTPSYSHGIMDDVPESHFSSGNYFHADELVQAVERFAKRVGENAGYMKSLYRQVQV